MHTTGEYTVADLMEAFSVGRPVGPSAAAG